MSKVSVLIIKISKASSCPLQADVCYLFLPTKTYELIEQDQKSNSGFLDCLCISTNHNIDPATITGVANDG
jgi:hypothetical protein